MDTVSASAELAIKPIAAAARTAVIPLTFMVVPPLIRRNLHRAEQTRSLARGAAPASAPSGKAERKSLVIGGWSITDGVEDAELSGERMRVMVLPKKRRPRGVPPSADFRP